MITVIELNKQIDTLNQRNYQTNCVFVIEQDCVRLFVCLLKRERYEVVIYTERRGTNLGAKRTKRTAEMVWR